MPTRAKIIRTIKARNINVSIFDPLAAMHSMPERDNVAMADLIYDFFGPIAYQTHSAIEIVHHTRKGPAGVEMEYTAADWRGGSASTFALRGVRVCNVMKKSEAESFDVEEVDRLSYFPNNARQKQHDPHGGCWVAPLCFCHS
jgi:RecA-family ATPase